MSPKIDLKKKFLEKVGQQKPRSKFYFRVSKTGLAIGFGLGILFSSVLIYIFTSNLIQLNQLKQLNPFDNTSWIFLALPELLVFGVLVAWLVSKLYKKLDGPLVGYKNYLTFAIIFMLLIFGVLLSFAFDKNLELRIVTEIIKEKIEKLPLVSNFERERLVDKWDEKNEFYGTVEKIENQTITIRFGNFVETFSDPEGLASQVFIGERIEVKYDKVGENQVIKKVERESEEKNESEHKT